MRGSHTLPVSMIKHQHELLRGIWGDRGLWWPAWSKTSCFPISIVDTTGYLWDLSSRSMGLHSQAPSFWKNQAWLTPDIKDSLEDNKKCGSVAGSRSATAEERAQGTQPGVWLETSLSSGGWWGLLKPASPSPELQGIGPSPSNSVPIHLVSAAGGSDLLCSTGDSDYISLCLSRNRLPGFSCRSIVTSTYWVLTPYVVTV